MPLKPLLRYFEGTVKPTRSRQMSKIRGKDTKPEMALRKAVHALGGRFRIHVRDLPGRPDMANKRAKVAVFVDGCFWHGCPQHFKPPRTRRLFWEEKIRRNIANRVAIRTAYDEAWRVLEVYECQLRVEVAKVAEQIVWKMGRQPQRNPISPDAVERVRLHLGP